MAIALRGNAYVNSGLHCDLTLTLSRAYRPQRGRGHVTPIVSCIAIHNNIQTKQWFVNYRNISCLDGIVHSY